jgi:parallel beta-helix repeat protein
MSHFVQRVRHGLFLCLAGLAFQTSSARAQQMIHVPGDQPTIQAGIDAAMNGDTVLVAPGTYTENIDFTGKAITVTSSEGPASTIIDASQGDIGVQFVTNETRASVLNGFTIENAGAAYWPNSSPSDYFMGIKVGYIAASYSVSGSGANPTITNNIIKQNYGYGIEIYFGGALVSGNTISYTSTQYNPLYDYGCDYDDGVGIAIQGTSNTTSIYTVVSNNTIQYNIGHCLGGGIELYAASGLTTITNNIIRHNQSLGEGGGIYMTNGNALSLVQNLIYGNTSAGGGGGVYFGNSSTSLLIINNTIVGNTISPNPELIDFYEQGSQIFFNGSVSGTAFFNNIIVAGDSYSAVACNPGYEYLSPTPLTINNSDIVNFSGPTFGGWCVVPPTLTTGMISADPEFVSENNESFHLQSGSPAVNSGSDLAPDLPTQDLDDNARVENNTVDMGVYEGPVAGIVSSPPGFSIVSTATSMTIQSGQSGTATLTVAPVGLYIGTVSFSCSQLPTNVSCSFSPAMLPFAGDGVTLTSNLTVTVSAMADLERTKSYRPNPSGLNSLLALAELIAIALLVGSEQRRSIGNTRTLRVTVLCLLLLSSVSTLISCGSSGGSQSTSLPTLPTQPSTTSSTIVITAMVTGNTVNTSRTISLAVTVTQ